MFKECGSLICNHTHAALWALHYLFIVLKVALTFVDLHLAVFFQKSLLPHAFEK